MNNLTSNALSVGQVLKIKEEIPKEMDTYIVQAGDTLYSIARKNNLSVDQLKALNNLVNNTLSIGQVLKIKPEDDEMADNYYVVQRGDSLYKIANMFGTTVKEIMTINNLTSSLLSVGQRLIIPNSTQMNQVYIVQAGDTLYAIARKYNTTVSAIQSLNNLATSTLTIGQKLLIP